MTDVFLVPGLRTPFVKAATSYLGFNAIQIAGPVVAGAIRATHPDFRYEPIAEPEELGNGGRLKWVSGRLGEAPAYAGTDFIIVRDGRIAAAYLFFDKLP